MRVPLSTYVSPRHRARLNELSKAGLKITAVIEIGIDLVYERMIDSGLVQGTAKDDDEKRDGRESST